MAIWSYYPLTIVLALIVCILFTIWILDKYKIIGGDTGTSRAKKDTQAYEDIQFEIKVKTWFLSLFENFANGVGGGISEKDEFEWGYRIMRVFPDIKHLNRKIKVIELIGVIRLISFILVLFGCFFIIWGNMLVGVILLAVCAVTRGIVAMAIDLIIDEMDKELERDFPSLYLLLYCRLVKGVNARLAPTLTDYMRSMDAIYLPSEHKQIRQFVMDLRNNIEVYSDESIAVSKLKEKYHSATMMNFVNLATQALRGADNHDTLLSFKTDLANREAKQMEAEARKRAEQAQFAVNAIYIILVEFILVSISSKLPSMDSIFGMLG